MKSRSPSTLLLRLTACLLSASLFATAFTSALTSAGRAEETQAKAPAPPSFEDLLRFNSAQVFGGKVTSIAGDKVELLFDTTGQMTKGFEGPGILDAASPDMKGSFRKFIIKDKKAKNEVLIPGLACVGLSGPSAGWTTWVSRFPLAGDPVMSFDLRLPGFVTSQSSLFVRLNLDGKSYLETNFLRTAEKHVRGSLAGKRETTLKEYSAHPMKWFPRSKPEGLPIEVGVQGDRFHVSIASKEAVGLDKIGEVSKGKVAFVFSKIAFTLQNVKIAGKIDREWCEAQLAELEKAGKLIRKDPAAEADIPPLPGGRPAGDGKKKPEDAKKDGKPEGGKKD